ncbi:MAG: hypothetical protein KDA81_15590 [Planctomycetaceae bacterium]|nr:hypothetical protein [Planctomycetaceae bacterium]
MLLTNTINALTNNTAAVNGSAIVCGVEFRGCSACPADSVDRPSHRSPKRRSERHSQPAAIYRGAWMQSERMPWQSSWQPSLLSQSAFAGLQFGLSRTLS